MWNSLSELFSWYFSLHLKITTRVKGGGGKGWVRFDFIDCVSSSSLVLILIICEVFRLLFHWWHLNLFPELKFFIIMVRENSYVAVEYTNIQYNWCLTHRRLSYSIYVHVLSMLSEISLGNECLFIYLIFAAYFFLLLILRDVLNICFNYYRIMMCVAHVLSVIIKTNSPVHVAMQPWFSRVRYMCAWAHIYIDLHVK